MTAIPIREDAFRIRRGHIQRRQMLRAVPAAAVAAGTLSMRQVVAVHADELRSRGKAMILLWMAGGPPQTETFDPRPELSEFGAIATATPGIEVCELWPEMAKRSDDLCIIRSMSNKEGEHQRATYQVHTGYVPSGSVKHPSIASSLGQQLRERYEGGDLPAVATIGGGRALPGAGSLEADYEPFLIPRPGEMPANIRPNVDERRYRRRLRLTQELDRQFGEQGNDRIARDHQALYQQTAALVTSPQTEAFELSGERQSVVRSYGDTDFGRGCLLARRLVERGVRFVEVVSPGWDMHDDLGTRMREKAGQVDQAFAALLRDLESRGMLDDTLVCWMGEFGRTPQINGRSGRDHFPRAFNSVLAGCGVRGGQVIGRNSRDGNFIEDRPVSVPDLHATFCQALEIDPNHEHITSLGRPMKIVDGGEAVGEVFSG